MNEPTAHELDEADPSPGSPRTQDARYSQIVILLAALGDAAFTGAVAVHVAFADGAVGRAVVVAAAAVTFVVATVVALVARRKAAVVAATVFIALAGVTVAVVSLDASRRYDALRRQSFGDRGGPRLVEPDSAYGREMGGAMLSGITASLAAIFALPVAGYFAARLVRAGRTP